ncbi:hypothetical protein D3C80_2204160 [compost metagenome]
MLEFVDPEHTPKNLLIRAVKSGRQQLNMKKWEQYEQYRQFLNIHPALELMLLERLPAEGK